MEQGTGTRLASGGQPFVAWLLSSQCACFFGLVSYRLMHSGRWMDLALTFAMVVASFLTALFLTKNQERE
jgi:CHASE2 domain-containing sensor protein